MSRIIALTIALVQAILALRFFRLLLRTRSGDRVRVRVAQVAADPISIIVPVLNEEDRLGPCLASLVSQPDSVIEILVVDGGSEDGTRSLVSCWELEDPRVRLLAVDRPAKGWNGKAWGLQTGLDNVSSDAGWIVTVDADVRLGVGAVNAAVGYAARNSIPVLSVAAGQSAPTPGLALVHPSLLSTLVYRFGAPGNTATSVGEVQSNGQFAVYRADALQRAGGFVSARDSICEDVTLARHLFVLGYDIGFFEGDGLATTEMYADGWECLTNWPRSLSLRDRIRPNAGVAGLVNILFLQVLPVMVVIGSIVARRHHAGPILALNWLLLFSRIGVAAGTRRAYVNPHATYWASPLFDPVTLLVYIRHLVRRQRVWRGRELVASR